MSKIVKWILTLIIIAFLAGVIQGHLVVAQYHKGYKDGLGIGLNNSCKEVKP